MNSIGKDEGRPLQNRKPSDKGSEYLRRVKELSSEQAEPSPPPPCSSAPTPSVAPSGKERRRSPRFHCSGSAEFRVEGTDVRLWGTLTDLSLHGCYVEINTTFPVDTHVQLILDAMDIRVQMQAVVRVSYPFLGMGLAFLKIEPGQLLQLKRLLAVLSEHAPAAAMACKTCHTASSTQSLADVDPGAMLDALTQFFRNNPLLSRPEFYALAKRARR